MAALITGFEVLSLPVAPGIPDVPYVQQGFFLQVSNAGHSAAEVTLLLEATPAFVASSGAATLFTDIIDQTGAPTQFSVPLFLEAPVGFTSQKIPAGATWLFGIQYILAPGSTTMVGGTPQDSFGTRGMAMLDASHGASLLLVATTRQVFNNYNAAGDLIDVAEAAYSLPILGGPLVKF